MARVVIFRTSSTSNSNRGFREGGEPGASRSGLWPLVVEALFGELNPQALDTATRSSITPGSKYSGSTS